MSAYVVNALRITSKHNPVREQSIEEQKAAHLLQHHHEEWKQKDDQFISQTNPSKNKNWKYPR